MSQLKMGGVFPPEETRAEENGFFEEICGPEGEVIFAMSGRCGTCCVLDDFAPTDPVKTAYVPLYICETAVAPFLKAGYELLFYDVDRNLKPVFSEEVIPKISILFICGYYGFSRYDREFVRMCRDRGIMIYQDVTFSAFSEDGLDPSADYIAGSFRKWVGAYSGGFALKRRGSFSKMPSAPDEKHILLRKKTVDNCDDEAFWEAELYLRRIFDHYASDDMSEYILRHMDMQKIREKRRENYSLLLRELVPLKNHLEVIFPELDPGVVPSHFSMYCDDRKSFCRFMEERRVVVKQFWPVGPQVPDLTTHPDVRYIYDHIVSLPCDQRYGEPEMKQLAAWLLEYDRG